MSGLIKNLPDDLDTAKNRNKLKLQNYLHEWEKSEIWENLVY